MVSYTEWTEIGHEVFQAKGGTYNGRETTQDVTQTLAAFWRNNTARLKSASKSEAREIARRNMTV